MPYTPPVLSAILQNKPVKELIPDETPFGFMLAEQLCIFINFIAAQKENQTYTDHTLRNNSIGVNIFVLEMIHAEKKKYFFPSESSLDSFIAKGLNVTAQNKLTAKNKLFYLNKFFQFISTNENELEKLLKAPFTVKELQKQIMDMLTDILSTLTKDIAELINGFPTEKAITKHAGTLVHDYIEQKEIQKKTSWYYSIFGLTPNNDRIKHAQLAELIISTIGCEDESNLPPKAITRSLRIKVGALLCITTSLEDASWLGLTPGSKLYELAKTILNTISVENLDDKQKLACLSAFHCFINSPKERANLEQAARIQFKENNLLENIDPFLDSLSSPLSKMEDKLRMKDGQNTVSNSKWPIATAMANVGAWIGQAPGYGFGSALGFAANQTQSFNPIKTIVGAAVGNMANAIFQTTSAGHFAFVMGDFIIGSTLTRAFAKVFECVGSYIGWAVLGGAGAWLDIAFDLSYKGLQAVCGRFLNYCDQHAIQMRHADRELIETLCDLPPGLFAEDKQNQIRYTLGEDDFEIVDTQTVGLPAFKSL